MYAAAKQASENNGASKKVVQSIHENALLDSTRPSAKSSKLDKGSFDLRGIQFVFE
jgi:hypothetical protein